MQTEILVTTVVNVRTRSRVSIWQFVCKTGKRHIWAEDWEIFTKFVIQRETLTFNESDVVKLATQSCFGDVSRHHISKSIWRHGMVQFAYKFAVRITIYFKSMYPVNISWLMTPVQQRFECIICRLTHCFLMHQSQILKYSKVSERKLTENYTLIHSELFTHDSQIMSVALTFLLYFLREAAMLAWSRGS